MKTKHVELWKCDVCQRWFPTSQIRKVPHDAIQFAGSNYLFNSSPPADPNPHTEQGYYDLWHSTTLPGGSVGFLPTSMGTSGDFRLKVQESTSGTPPLMGTSLLYAASTFTGPRLLAPIVDGGMGIMSSWDHFCIGADVGPKEDEAVPFNVSVGIWDVNHGYDLAHCTFYRTINNVVGQEKVWFTLKVSDFPYALADCWPVFYFDCAADTKYWIQNAFWMKDVDYPFGKPFYQTINTPVEILKDTPSRTAVYCCQKDADEVLLRRRTPGRRENRMIPPYEERET